MCDRSYSGALQRGGCGRGGEFGLDEKVGKECNFGSSGHLLQEIGFEGALINVAGAGGFASFVHDIGDGGGEEVLGGV